MSVSKTRLIETVAIVTNSSKGDAERAVSSFLSAIQHEATGGEKVIIQGFGTFEMKTRAAREGRNMRTGETIQIPAKTSLTFKAAKPKAAA